MLDFLDGDGTRASKRTVRDCYLLGENSATRASDSDGDNEALFYLFNFDNDEGFAIVGADTRLPTDIFAITDSGNIDPEVEIDNPGLALFLAAIGEWPEFIKPAPDDGDLNSRPPGSQYRYEYSDWTNYRYPCLRSGVRWHQGDPYNLYNPLKNSLHTISGCVAVAVAQLMACWEYPSSINGYPLDWELMKSGGVNSQFMISRVMRELGRSHHLDIKDDKYGLKETEADSKKVPKTMKALGYSSWGSRKHYDADRVNSELIAGYPLIARGDSHKKKVFGINIYEGGHAWLIEELLERTRYEYTYLGERVYSTKTQTEFLVYCNWGWGGRSNGYYYHRVFNANDQSGGPETITRSNEDYHYKYHFRTCTGIRK